MNKKNFVFKPATIEYWKEAGKKKMRISYYQTDPNSGDLVRKRPTYDLNRSRIIKSGVQKKLANDIADRLNNYLLPAGYPFQVDFDGRCIRSKKKIVHFRESEADEDLTENQLTPVLEAIEFARDFLLSQGFRHETVKSYKSIAKLLSNFIKKKGWEDLKISEFSKKHAQAYMNHCAIDRKVGPVTYNNNRRNGHVLFEVLVDNEYLLLNPFKKIKTRKKLPKKRNRFTPEHRNIVANYIETHHPWFFYAVLLQYFCLIRPVEIARLKFGHFNFSKQIIEMPPEIRKNWEYRPPTIPTAIMPYFVNPEFTKYPSNYYLFDKGLVPGFGKGYVDKTFTNRAKQMYEKHRKILQHLVKTEQIETMTGYQWYTWVDTGVDDRRREGMPIDEIVRQKGYSKTGSKVIYDYFHYDEVIEEMKGVKNVLRLA